MEDAPSIAALLLRIRTALTSDDVHDSGAGFHAVNPRASVYWNPSKSASGNYTLKATFVLNKPERSREFSD